MTNRMLQDIQEIHELSDDLWSARALPDLLQSMTEKVARVFRADRVSLL